MELSNTTRVISGVILITVPTIEFGGAFLLSMLKSSWPGYVDNPLRQTCSAPVMRTRAFW